VRADKDAMKNGNPFDPEDAFRPRMGRKAPPRGTGFRHSGDRSFEGFSGTAAGGRPVARRGGGAAWSQSVSHSLVVVGAW
jgi:hypothetical protein